MVLTCRLIAAIFVKQFIHIKLKAMKNHIIFIVSTLLSCLPLSFVSAQNILVEEHFVENDKGWNLGEDKDVKRSIENGRLVMESKKYTIENGVHKSKGGYWIKMPESKLPADNYSITFTTRWKKNMKNDEKYSPYGMILGDYYFLVYADGDRRLLKWDTTAKKYETIVDWGVQAAINKKDLADNNWEIRYQDGKAAFYGNGNMLYKKEILIPKDTYIKLYVENSEVVAFDDIVVKKL